MEPAAAADYGYLRQLVFDVSQNVLDPSRDYLFEARLSKLLRNQGIARMDELVRQLRSKKNPALERAIAEAMTINETSFFRDLRPFELLRTRTAAANDRSPPPHPHTALMERRLLHRPGGLQPGHAASRALSHARQLEALASKAPT